jgi:hypothetical protein
MQPGTRIGNVLGRYSRDQIRISIQEVYESLDCRRPQRMMQTAQNLTVRVRFGEIVTAGRDH